MVGLFVLIIRLMFMLLAAALWCVWAMIVGLVMLIAVIAGRPRTARSMTRSLAWRLRP
jgi:hypothetical protein